MRSSDVALVLPYPIRLERQFGAASLSATGTPLSLRLHADDWELLKREAMYLNAPASQIARWFVVHGAQQLALVRTGHAPVVRP